MTITTEAAVYLGVGFGFALALAVTARRDEWRDPVGAFAFIASPFLWPFWVAALVLYRLNHDSNDNK